MTDSQTGVWTVVESRVAMVAPICQAVIGMNHWDGDFDYSTDGGGGVILYFMRDRRINP